MLSSIGLTLFGLVAGVIAKLLIPGRDPGGLVAMALGIGGSLAGGYLAKSIGLDGPSEGAAFFMALLGSVSLLALYRMAIRRTV
jgi:uncharacterized membrane protein YeaQ/YmgE (transglycosylase-associated protein family)